MDAPEKHDEIAHAQGGFYLAPPHAARFDFSHIEEDESKSSTQYCHDGPNELAIRVAVRDEDRGWHVGTPAKTSATLGTLRHQFQIMAGDPMCDNEIPSRHRTRFDLRLG
jgi:hypothetical protein